jgi:5,10-methylenetetrahydrofolate reductase
MPFTADLNPKSGKSTDLLEMIKMEDYMDRKRASMPKAAAKTATPVADAILANDMIKSSADDIGTQFRFNNSQK